jgi:hypothetical protein
LWLLDFCFVRCTRAGVNRKINDDDECALLMH